MKGWFDMPAMLEGDQPMKREELGDTIYNIESEKTPVMRMLPTGKRPNQMLSEWPAQVYPKRGYKGTVEGTDISSFNSTGREKMQNYAMWLRTEGWRVGKLANLTVAAGVQRNERGKQAADDALILAQMGERQILSLMDLQTDNGTTNAYQSRAMFVFLQTAAQSLLPVPADLRPASGANYTGTLANFTPAQLEAMLEISSIAKKAPVDLFAPVGIALKSQMSSWTQRSDDEANKTAIEATNMNANDKKLIHVVNTFEFDSGMVKTVPSYFLITDNDTGEDTDYTKRSGLFIDLSMWEKRWLQAPTGFKQPEQSGGPRGYHDQVMVLVCKNPLGQNSAQISA